MYKNEFMILEDCAERFAISLNLNLTRTLIDIVSKDNYKAMVIKFKDVQDFLIQDYIDKHCRRRDGVYILHGTFYNRFDLEKLIKPFCKVVSISVFDRIDENIDIYYPKLFVEE